METFTWIILVWLAHFAAGWDPAATQHFPFINTVNHSSLWLSSQLPSAFWEGEGPSEPVIVLLKAKYELFTALSACPLPVICASFAHVKHKQLP